MDQCNNRGASDEMTFLKYEVINHEEFGRVASHSLFTNHPAVVIPVFISLYIELPFLKCRNYNHKGEGNIAS